MARQQGRFSSFIIRLAVVATALSVAAMVVSMAVVIGFKQEIRGRIFSFWGHVQVAPYSGNNSSIVAPEPFVIDKDLHNAIKHMPEVKTVAPYVIRPVILNANELMEGVQLKGLDSAYTFPERVELTGNMIDYSDDGYAKQVMLSDDIANRLKLSIGDDVLLYFLEPGSTFPRIRKVKLCGLYHTGLEDIDRNYGICDIRLLQKINKWSADEINGYQLSLTDVADADTVANKIFNDLIPQTSRLTTYTMKEIFAGIYDWLRIQNMTAGMVLLIMAIVAIINLAAALLILIVEQTKMIGVLKAQGMQNSMLRKVFVYHAAIIGFLGVLGGNILGLGLCFIQQQTGFLKLSETGYFMKTVPVHIVWWQIVLLDIATLALCILFMWLPSLYIRRIKPARVLQFK